MPGQDRITYFAETDARNRRVKFGIKPKDRLRHLYVIGKTGVGKSTLLENMAIQDIQNGEGMAFIDPHGGTAEKLLDYIPENRIKDVLYFAPFDMEYPISFNILEDIGADKRHLVVNGLMSTFEKIWVDAWSARMAYILQNTILALLEMPGSTLLGVNRMLTDKDFRKKVIDNVKDPSTRAFWVDEFSKYTDRYAAEATPAIQNKVGQFTSNPLVRNLVGQSKSTFDIRQMMDQKKIMIINLSKGRVGEGNANLIGAMLITKIYLAAMSRADKSDSELAKLPSFYLYVDEFQSFANKSFADILSEARKYKLSLNIAHQYVEQMEEEVRDAVFGNVGTMISFRVGALDAELLEKEFAPTFSAEDLVNLGFAQIYLKLMIDGISSSPFSAVTIPPIARPEKCFKEAVVAASREQFARPREDVEKDIIEWHAPLESSFSPDKKNFDRDEKISSMRNKGNFSSQNRTFSQSGQGGQGGTKNQFSEKRNFSNEGNKNASNDFARPGTSQNKPEKPDENKMAFAKAAAELFSKNDVVPQENKIESEEVSFKSERPEKISFPGSHPESTPQISPKIEQNIFNRPKVPLSNLSVNPEAKKTPSKENLSSLKDALSKLISDKPVKENVNNNVRPIANNNQLQRVSEKPVEEKKEQKFEKPRFEKPNGLKPNEPKSEEKKPEEKKPEPEELKKQPLPKNEVPEDVLRKLLDMNN